MNLPRQTQPVPGTPTAAENLFSSSDEEEPQPPPAPASSTVQTQPEGPEQVQGSPEQLIDANQLLLLNTTPEKEECAANDGTSPGDQTSTRR